MEPFVYQSLQEREPLLVRRSTKAPFARRDTSHSARARPPPYRNEGPSLIGIGTALAVVRMASSGPRYWSCGSAYLGRTHSRDFSCKLLNPNRHILPQSGK